MAVELVPKKVAFQQPLRGGENVGLALAEWTPVPFVNVIDGVRRVGRIVVAAINAQCRRPHRYRRGRVFFGFRPMDDGVPLYVRLRQRFSRVEITLERERDLILERVSLDRTDPVDREDRFAARRFVDCGCARAFGRGSALKVRGEVRGERLL